MPDRPPSEQIRALIEEVDRLCRETEAVTNEVDRSMRRGAFWPERRKTARRDPSEVVGVTDRER